MRIDKSYGYAAFWLNGAFYRVRKADSWIKDWELAIWFSKRQIGKLKVKPIGQHFSEEKRKRKIETHKSQIARLKVLIKNMKLMRPLHNHAIEMIQQEIIQDNWKGES
jgi:hypothetical protein